jgi:hypothetical protein
VKTPTPLTTDPDRARFLEWAGTVGDALDGRLNPLDELLLLVPDVPPPVPTAPAPVAEADPPAQLPDPSAQLKFTASLLAATAIMAVVVTLAARLLRRR